MNFNCYLYFDGNCEEAFKFYEKLFGGKIESIFLHEGTPAARQVPPEWQKKVLHARMTIGNTVLMASDAPPGRFHKQQGFSINIGALWYLMSGLWSCGHHDEVVFLENSAIDS